MPGNVEIFITNNGWGGDAEIDATGDLVLAIDTPGNPVATQQRIYRLLMDNPRLFDPATNAPISVPSDVFAPDRGAGLRAEIGQMITTSLVGGIESRITAGLQQEPGLLSSVPPTVTVANAGDNVVQVNTACTAVDGEIVTIPSFPLPLLGG